MNNHEINAKRHWSFDSVRAACIRNHLYTVACDIKEHSDGQTITNVMFILEREAVTTTFEIDGSDEI